jgi:hypothetical protein
MMINVDDSLQRILFPQDVMLQTELEKVLHRHYPGHAWSVDCNIRQGMINVHNLFLSGMYGFRLKLHGAFSASQVEHDVMMAGGELLERYRLTRGEFNVEKWCGLRTDFAGNLIADRG